MRNKNATFWRTAALSLPAHVRTRYAGYFERAERWEATLDALVDIFTNPRLHRRPRSLSASSSSG